MARVWARRQVSNEAKGPERVTVYTFNDGIDYVRADIIRRVVETRDAYDAHDGAVKRWLTVQDETSWQAESRGLYDAWIDAMNEARKALKP